MSANRSEEEKDYAIQARKQCIKNLGEQWSQVELNEIDCVYLK